MLSVPLSLKKNVKDINICSYINVFATVLGEQKKSQKYLNYLLEMVGLVDNQGKLLFFQKILIILKNWDYNVCFSIKTWLPQKTTQSKS